MDKTEIIQTSIADGLVDVLKGALDKPGFALLVFDFGDQPSIGNYISNADRTTMIKTLREFADHLEKNGDFPPTIGGIQ